MDIFIKITKVIQSRAVSDFSLSFVHWLI